MKKAIFYLLPIFLLLIYFNLSKAQRDIRLSQIPKYQITLTNPPLDASANQPVDFTWNVQAPDTATTTLTTIYYGHVSSPSALTTSNSPQAVGYPYSLPDYSTGNYFLPDTFSASTSFFKGNIFYRAYAKVGNQHLWSEEKRLDTH
jgi:hypothetical protein